MKKKMKRAKAAKARWEQEVKGKMETIVRKFSRQWKIQERIDAANAWATNHPKRTVAMTIGALVCSLGECAAHVRRTSEHTEWQERAGAGSRAAGHPGAAVEMGTGFLGTYPCKDASGFNAHHI